MEWIYAIASMFVLMFVFAIIDEIDSKNNRIVE